MDEKNSQENATEAIEPTETAIDINSLSSETKSDILSRTKDHRENIDRFHGIIVPQYVDDQYVNNNYVVTYSCKDNSILGWKINIEENGQQHPDMYFKLDQKCDRIKKFVLYKKTLIFNYRDFDKGNCKYLF